MRNLVLVGLVIAGALLLGPAAMASRADEPSFGDCASRDYLANFDERLRTIEYDCVERLRAPVATRSGTRHIRLLHDRSSDWLTDEAMLAEFDRGVQLAIEQLGRIGPFDMKDVSILLADDFPPRRDAESFTGIAAWTYMERSGDEPECQIVLFLLGPGGLAENSEAVIAHEIFHCVQKANLAPEQIGSLRPDGAASGAWWIEGSATWFASAAVPEVGNLQVRIDNFDTLSPTTPLYEMRYEGVAFFLWLAGDRGDAAVLPFLAGMAPDASESAQIAAMGDALSGDEWLGFAQAYLDGEIRRPRGEPIRFSPTEGETLRWEETREVRRPLRPFVIDRAWLECDCGTWTTSAEPDDVHRVRADGGAWGALPGRIDTEAGDDAWFRLAAINAGGSPRNLVFDFTHDIPCEGCAGGGLDPCVAGGWRLSGGGTVEWMRENMPPGVRIPVADRSDDVVTFTRTGGYFAGEIRQRTVMTIDHADGRTRADGATRTRASGRWAAEGGTLTLCPASERLEGQVVISRPDGSTGTMDLSPEGLARSAAARRDQIDAIPPEYLDDIPPHLRARLAEQRAYAARLAEEPVPPPTPQAMSYTCSGDTLRTTLPVPGHPPIVSTYVRVG